MKKYILFIFCFLLFICVTKAQLLYLQENYKGGISMDGKSYYGQDYLQPDTINFVNAAPVGSVIKKAFLIGDKFAYYYGTEKKQDTPMPFIFNANAITIDSTSQIAPYFTDDPFSFIYNWIIVKDVTNYALFSNNQLITPCQYCLISNNQTNFVYDGFLLVILYENTAMPTTNVAVFLNDQNSSVTMTQVLNNINPINSSKDVALSINTNYIEDSVLFTLNSSHNLGYLRPHASGDITKLPGSFYYQNNTLVGLADDINSPFIDTTDALANIKTYISNNTTNLSLVSQGHVQSRGDDGIQSFILAYTTPCPARSITPIQNYTLCNGSGKILTTSSGTLNTTYNWFAVDSSLNNYTIANPIASPTATASYIAYIDSAGCKHTEHFNIAVIPSPKFDSLSISNVICGNAGNTGAAVVAGTKGGTAPYSYNIGGVAQASNSFNNLTVGNYTATVTDNNGCTEQQAFTIKQVNIAQADFTFAPTTICVNDPVQFNLQTTTTNLQTWSFALQDSLTQNPVYVFSDTGTYQITLIAWRNQRQCSDTVTKTLVVKDCPPDSLHITVPNVFSPNADGINDTWQLIVYNFNYTVNNYECIIYDRWGIKVFETNNINTAWDGKTTSGMPSNAGTYYYIIKLTATNSKGVSEQKDFKGYLELVR